MSGEDNATQQRDEIEALSAIYGDDFTVVDEQMGIYSVSVSVEKLTVCFVVTLPSGYPCSSPPRFDIEAHWLRGSRRQQLEQHLEQIYIEHLGECLLYLWCERVREFLQGLSEVDDTTKDLADMVVTEAIPSPTTSSHVSCPTITSGDLIIDRKSVFQPHLARVTSVDQVPVVLSRLKENRKISAATHNIWAYRIALQGGGRGVAQDCEDDGETKAGSRMLHLMGVLNVLNVLVIVTRWYGGCHLGPDRFKHINTATRAILDHCGLLQEAGKEKKSKKT